jgi:hypothetical protein
MQMIKIATLIVAIGLSAHSAPPANETNAIHYWAFDRSDPSLTRAGDVWAAARVETANETIRLLREVDGKLTAYWESRDSECWKTVKQQLIWAPSLFVPADDGAFVSARAIRSFDYKDGKDGKPTYVLKGTVAVLGSVSDPAAIKILEQQLRELDRTLPH